MPQWMVMKDSNVVFPYNAGAFDPGIFFDYDGALPPIDKVLGKRVLRTSYDPEMTIAEPPSKEEIKEKVAAKEEQDERLTIVTKAIGTLKKIDFATESGMPTLYVLNKKCGFRVTDAERKAAYAAYKLSGVVTQDDTEDAPKTEGENEQIA